MAGGLRIIGQDLETVTKWNTIWRWNEDLSDEPASKRTSANHGMPRGRQEIDSFLDALETPTRGQLDSRVNFLTVRWDNSGLCHRLGRAAVADLWTACFQSPRRPPGPSTAVQLLLYVWHIPLHPSQHQEAVWVNYVPYSTSWTSK